VTYFGSAFLQSIPQLNLVGGLQPADSSLGLPAPFSTCQIPRSTSRQVSTSAYVASSGFGYPLGALLPWHPGELSFTLAALVGFTLRSLTLHSEVSVFLPSLTHLPFFRQVTQEPSCTPLVAAASGSRPHGELRFVRTRHDDSECSLGSFLSRVFYRRPGSFLQRISSLVLGFFATHATDSPALQSITHQRLAHSTSTVR
jgi:hypothetical protein